MPKLKILICLMHFDKDVCRWMTYLNVIDYEPIVTCR